LAGPPPPLKPAHARCDRSVDNIHREFSIVTTYKDLCMSMPGLGAGLARYFCSGASRVLVSDPAALFRSTFHHIPTRSARGCRNILGPIVSYAIRVDYHTLHLGRRARRPMSLPPCWRAIDCWPFHHRTRRPRRCDPATFRSCPARNPAAAQRHRQGWPSVASLPEKLGRGRAHSTLMRSSGIAPLGWVFGNVPLCSDFRCRFRLSSGFAGQTGRPCLSCHATQV